jgi:hypothetical protein
MNLTPKIIAAITAALLLGVVVANTAGAGVEAGQQSGRVVVNATELTGTVLGKTADALKWANERAAEARIPTRTLRPGECVDTTAGRYCRPAAGTSRPATPTRAGTCVVDSKGVM